MKGGFRIFSRNNYFHKTEPSILKHDEVYYVDLDLCRLILNTLYDYLVNGYVCHISHCFNSNK